VNNVFPNNQTDVATLVHDIEYLIYNSENVDLIDDTAIQNADWTLPGITTKAGLTFRKFTGWEFNKALPGKSVDETTLIGNSLKYIVTEDPSWKAALQGYSLKWS
jgi:hypothetical protein